MERTLPRQAPEFYLPFDWAAVPTQALGTARGPNWPKPTEGHGEEKARKAEWGFEY